MMSQTITSPCPVCDTMAERQVYDIGSGPELSCAVCEWCWGAEGQDLQPLDVAQIATDAFRLRLAQFADSATDDVDPN